MGQYRGEVRLIFKCHQAEAFGCPIKDQGECKLGSRLGVEKKVITFTVNANNTDDACNALGITAREYVDEHEEAVDTCQNVEAVERLAPGSKPSEICFGLPQVDYGSIERL
ncbi:MAG: hypothetical protein AAB557_04295 [Patescibacteria group bacterium]